MSQHNPAGPCVLITRHNSPNKRIDVVDLPTSNPTIDTLKHATADLYSLPSHTLASLTYQYHDDEGDLVRMDTTAELVEVLKERAEMGTPLVLMVGQTGDEGLAALSDADSDDSDSFVRVEASDFQSDSPSSAANSHSNLAIRPHLLQAERAVSEPESRSPQTASPAADNTELAATAPTQPTSTHPAVFTPAIQPATQPLADSPSQLEATQQIVPPHSEANAQNDAKHEERQPQHGAVRPMMAVNQPFTVPLVSLPFVRRHNSAPAASDAHPITAAVNRKLGAFKRLVNCVGQRWTSEVRRVVKPRLRRAWAVLSESARAVKDTFSREIVFILGVKFLIVGIGLCLTSWYMAPATEISPKSLEARVKTIERRIEYSGQNVLADNDFAMQSLEAMYTMANKIVRLEAQVEQQQLTIDSLSTQLNRDVSHLTSLIDQRFTELSTQQWASTKPYKGRSWFDDEWQSGQVKTADKRATYASLYDDNIDDLLLESVFGESPQDELKAYKQPAKQRKSDTRRSSVASKSPSSAVWSEPALFATSAAWSSTSPSAESYAAASSTYASSQSSSLSSSASASSSLYDSERKSARSERADRRERRRQERDAANSPWSFSHFDDERSDKPAAATSDSQSQTQPADTHSFSSCRRSTTHDDQPSNHHKPTDCYSSTTSCSNSGSKSGHKRGKAEKSLKAVGKKIGKALQTVNDAAKRVWKAWKSQW